MFILCVYVIQQLEKLFTCVYNVRLEALQNHNFIIQMKIIIIECILISIMNLETKLEE